MWKTTDRYIQQVGRRGGGLSQVCFISPPPLCFSLAHPPHLFAEEAEGGRSGQQAEAGVHPHLVSHVGGGENPFSGHGDPPQPSLTLPLCPPPNF